jgi:hypothetical protein
MDTKSPCCSVPKPWTPSLLIAQFQNHGHQVFALLSSKTMDTKTSDCSVPNPWTPRLLVAQFQIYGHQDFWLLSSKSMDTKTCGCSVPNPWTPRLVVAQFQIHGQHQDFWLLTGLIRWSFLVVRYPKIWYARVTLPHRALPKNTVRSCDALSLLLSTA